METREITKAIVQEIGKRDARIYELELTLREATAAPELLEALKVAESELRYHAATRNSEALEIVRAAIQKATGGEQ
jgi:hypothetical protein